MAPGSAGFAEMVPLAPCFAAPIRNILLGVTYQIKAFVERFDCIAEEDHNPPLGRYEKYPDKDCALLMTAAIALRCL